MVHLTPSTHRIVSGADGVPVLVKRATEAGARARLLTESTVLEALAHPRVVRVSEVVEDGDAVELHLAWVGSHTLATVAGLGPAAAAEVVASLAATVADVHAVGLVHRRLVADHVLLGPGGTPVLTGFAEAIGTGHADPADDVAALGALLTGLVAPGPAAMEMPERRRDPWADRWRSGASRRDRGLRGALLTLADQAQAEDPSARPTAAELASSLRATAGLDGVPDPDPAGGGPGSPAPPGRPRTRRIDPPYRGRAPRPEGGVGGPIPRARPRWSGRWWPGRGPRRDGTGRSPGRAVVASRQDRGAGREERGGAARRTAGGEALRWRAGRTTGSWRRRTDGPPTDDERGRSAGPRSQRLRRRPVALAVASAMGAGTVAVVVVAWVGDIGEPAPVGFEVAVPSPTPSIPPPTPTGPTPPSSSPTSTTASDGPPVVSGPAPVDCPDVVGPAADVDGDGCPDPIRVAGERVSAGTMTWSVGEPGDRVAVADWDCDGTATPAVLRPATGEVFVYDRWAGPGDALTVGPVGRIDGATDIVVAEGVTCPDLVVSTTLGDLVPVARGVDP